MRSLLIVGCLAVAACSSPEPRFAFADLEEGRAVMTAEDGFLSRVGAIEVGVRVEDAEATSPDALRALYHDGVTTFSAEERARLEALLEAEHDTLTRIADHLPPTVLFVATDGTVEWSAPHTRANAIIFTPSWLAAEDRQFRRTFYHELFHVISRHDPALREQAYALIGFEPCAVTVPDSLARRRITNPDAPTHEHYLPLDLDGADGVVPYTYTFADGYSPDVEGFAFLQFGLIAVTETDGQCTPVTALGEDGLLSPQDVPAYVPRTGGNTDYIIHAEEVMADNFVMWVEGDTDLPSPQIPAELGRLFTSNE